MRARSSVWLVDVHRIVQTSDECCNSTNSLKSRLSIGASCRFGAECFHGGKSFLDRPGQPVQPILGGVFECGYDYDLFHGGAWPVQ